MAPWDGCIGVNGPGSDVRVSVIVPVYNAAAFLETAVRSALDQEEVAEVVLAEDGSTDDSPAIAERLARDEPRVRLVRHLGGVNRGAGAARNLGIRNSSCPYVAFLDADDFFLEHRFRRARALFEAHPDIDGVYEAVGTRFYDAEAERRYRTWRTATAVPGQDITLTTVEHPVPPGELFETLLMGRVGWFHCDGLVVKRALLDRTQLFDTELRLSQDREMWHRLALYGTLMAGELTRPVAVRGVHANNRSTNTQALRRVSVLYWSKMVDLCDRHEVRKRARRFTLRRRIDCYDDTIATMAPGARRRLRKLACLVRFSLERPRYVWKCL